MTRITAGSAAAFPAQPRLAGPALAAAPGPNYFVCRSVPSGGA
jgi:hypothetical protein